MGERGDGGEGGREGGRGEGGGGEEDSVLFGRDTQHNILENSPVHGHCHENLESYIHRVVLNNRIQ